jgi:DNA-directed RNA polymerase subunit M/transcription elongation factor TFIIS
MRTLTPGQWYLRFTCEHCQQKEILFADLSRGQTKLKATYVVQCSSCSHTGSYDGDDIERYQHPLSADA